MTDHLDTPTLLLDEPRLRRNIARMKERFTGACVLRPHLKTCKSVRVARTLLEDGAEVKDMPIAVSTLLELEYFAREGYRDIMYTLSMAPQKVKRVRRLQEEFPTLRPVVILHNVDAARAVEKAAAEEGKHLPPLDVCIEVDTDGVRAGLPPDSPELPVLGKVLEEECSHLTCAGIVTHFGGSYATRGDEGVGYADAERKGAVRAAAALLDQAEIKARIVSVGSTPTAVFGENRDGLTEFRAGVFVFMDLVMTRIGACEVSDIAISVLATVVAHQNKWHDGAALVLDAGRLALSADPGNDNPPHYGVVCHPDTCDPFPGLRIAETSQEHGMVPLPPSDLQHYPIGSRVRILPNHACITAAAYPGYHVIDAAGAVVAYWERCNGW